jgi:GNAT superfamily N-acetyltransferase
MSSQDHAIRRCVGADFDTMYAVVNAAATAYAGVIPEDRYHVPYMPAEELRDEIAAGVRFWGWYDADGLSGVMGIQDVDDVTLIRHAYVRPDRQGAGIGSRLLAHLVGLPHQPLLVGTWADATWAVGFYERHGFRLVPQEEKDRLLRRYWSIPERQVDTSVVLRLVDDEDPDANGAPGPGPDRRPVHGLGGLGCLTMLLAAAVAIALLYAGNVFAGIVIFAVAVGVGLWLLNVASARKK